MEGVTSYSLLPPSRTGPPPTVLVGLGAEEWKRAADVCNPRGRLHCSFPKTKLSHVGEQLVPALPKGSERYLPDYVAISLRQLCAQTTIGLSLASQSIPRQWACRQPIQSRLLPPVLGGVGAEEMKRATGEAPSAKLSPPRRTIKSHWNTTSDDPLFI